MADKFVKLKSVARPEHEQMVIYGILRSYKRLPERERERIRELCGEIGGEWAAVLLRFLTTGQTFSAAVQRSHVPEGKLRSMRGEVYRRWEL